MTDTWIPKRAANRQMPLEEAYDIIEWQRELMMKFLTTNQMLSQLEKMRIYEDCQLMKAWLLDHQIPKENATRQTPD